ncbi:hypothetical protein PHJA_000570600 [Phtheirospermum japonicum]|uniref:Uncharacterized protein n=1 Tax=Phtheirospermum japonicum TaxID=374723 RepID=A0A830BG35_9LAMI|nr:hypothetical protein PHJA_000570600 [Phtheirospermum japonicum]
MVLLAEKLVLSLKFLYKSDKNHLKKHSKSLDEFLSKISNFLNQPLFKPGTVGSKSLSLEWFQNYFDLINLADKAFAELVIEIEYPMSQWGGKATDEYLNYSLSFLENLNIISSSLSHINQAKVSISQALILVEKDSQAAAAKSLRKIQGIRNLNINPGRGFKVEGCSSSGIKKRHGSDKKEGTILEAVMVLKKIGSLALGIVLAGFDDPVKKNLEIRGPVEEVNRGVERLCEGKCDEGVLRELKGRLVVLGNCVQGVEKRVNDMFSQVLAARSMLLDNIRLLICEQV